MTFTAPASGPSVTFSTTDNGTVAPGETVATCAIVNTGSASVATSPAITANGAAGIVNATATARGVTTPVTFSLSNRPVVSGVSPGSGDVQGNGTVTTAGRGFGTDASKVRVTFGAANEMGIHDGAIVAVTDTTIQVMPPMHGAGPVPVTVAGVAASNAPVYTYGTANAQPQPHATVAPAIGPYRTPPTHIAGARSGTPLPQPTRR